MPRAWSVIAFERNRQYAGNVGYRDEPSRMYAYDSDVANHKRVGVGDLLFVRGHDGLVGVGTVARIV